VVVLGRRSPRSSCGSRLAASSSAAVLPRTRHVMASEGIHRHPPTPQRQLRGEGSCFVIARTSPISSRRKRSAACRLQPLIRRLVVSNLRTSHYPCAGRAPPAPAVRCPRKARRPKITITN
jgi:hypothetical protein